MTVMVDSDLEAIRRRASADPVWKAQHLFGFHAWSKQREILHSVRDHGRTAVKACHGPGKTATAAVVALDFLTEHEGARVVTTAPTWPQVTELLWREIAGLYHRARIPVGGHLTQTKLELGPDWFAIGLSTDKPERFQGHHAEHLLLIVDEASGVDEAIFEAGEGFLTADGGRILLIGNPTQVTGQFHRAFTSERRLWNTVSISAFDTPAFTGEEVPPEVLRRLVTKRWVDEKRVKWGEASPAYQVRVLGDFPTSSDDNVIPLGVVEKAQQRTTAEKGRRLLSCDVARFGSDETVIALRDGKQARIVEVYHGRDTMETAGRIIRHAAYYAVDAVVIDDPGLGGGVTDRLREQRLPFQVEAFTGSGRPVAERDEYPNRRSEAWFATAEALVDVDLDDDEQLLADLVAPKYKIDSQGRRVVEPKDETKKRLGRSPDRGDAIVMLFAPSVPSVELQDFEP